MSAGQDHIQAHFHIRCCNHRKSHDYAHLLLKRIPSRNIIPVTQPRLADDAAAAGCKICHDKLPALSVFSDWIECSSKWTLFLAFSDWVVDNGLKLKGAQSPAICCDGAEPARRAVVARCGLVRAKQHVPAACAQGVLLCAYSWAVSTAS